MSGTSLSPRLHHLLIQGDPLSDRLPRLPRLSLDATARPLSPPISPTSSAFGLRPADMAFADLTTRAFAARPLPSPTSMTDERRGAGALISSLLNADLRAAHANSPPSSASSSESFISRQSRFSPTLPPMFQPRPAASRSHSQGDTLSGPRPTTSSAETPFPYGSMVGPASPTSDTLRRHSLHPYGYIAVPHGNAGAFVVGPSGMGARAPISRTTKACNACRGRKVRCDAGGADAGGEVATCSRCRESGVPCVYSGVQKKRGPCPGSVRGPHASTGKTRQPTYRPFLTHTPPAETALQVTYKFPALPPVADMADQKQSGRINRDPNDWSITGAPEVGRVPGSFAEPHQSVRPSASCAISWSQTHPSSHAYESHRPSSSGKSGNSIEDRRRPSPSAVSPQFPAHAGERASFGGSRVLPPLIPTGSSHWW